MLLAINYYSAFLKDLQNNYNRLSSGIKKGLTVNLLTVNPFYLSIKLL